MRFIVALAQSADTVTGEQIATGGTRRAVAKPDSFGGNDNRPCGLFQEAQYTDQERVCITQRFGNYDAKKLNQCVDVCKACMNGNTGYLQHVVQAQEEQAEMRLVQLVQIAVEKFLTLWTLFLYSAVFIACTHCITSGSVASVGLVKIVSLTDKEDLKRFDRDS